jgi:hypothetical protein
MVTRPPGTVEAYRTASSFATSDASRGPLHRFAVPLPQRGRN